MSASISSSQTHCRSTAGPGQGNKKRRVQITSGGVEEIWNEEVHAAFMEALLIYPPLGKHRIRYQPNGPGHNNSASVVPMGRCQLIQSYIFDKTGKSRTTKQISSHVQQIKRCRENMNPSKPTMPPHPFVSETPDVFHVAAGPLLPSKVSQGIDFGSFEIFGRHQDSNGLGLPLSEQLFSPSSPSVLSTSDSCNGLPLSADLRAYPFLMSPFGKNASGEISGENLNGNSDISVNNFRKIFDPYPSSVFEECTQPSVGSPSPVALNTSTSNRHFTSWIPSLRCHVPLPTRDQATFAHQGSTSPARTSPTSTLLKMPGHFLRPITPGEQIGSFASGLPRVGGEHQADGEEYGEVGRTHNISRDTFCIPPRFQLKSTFQPHYGSPFGHMLLLPQAEKLSGRLSLAATPTPETINLQLPRCLSYPDSYTTSHPVRRGLNSLENRPSSNSSSEANGIVARVLPLPELTTALQQPPQAKQTVLHTVMSKEQIEQQAGTQRYLHA